MNERAFLELLEKRADEQERLIKQMPLQKIFVTASIWLGEHPWRILIPLAFILTMLLRAVLGYRYYELVLKIFGGFGFLH